MLKLKEKHKFIKLKAQQQEISGMSSFVESVIIKLKIMKIEFAC